MKLKKEELLEWLDEKIDNYNNPAYKQIKEMIQKKPEVTEEFVKKWVNRLRRQKKEYTDEQREYFIKQLLKDAEVEVVGK